MSVIAFPSPALSIVIKELEAALAAAQAGTLSGVALSYTTSDGIMRDCLEVKDYPSAILLLGQTNMVRIDLIDMAKKMRDECSD